MQNYKIYRILSCQIANFLKFPTNFTRLRYREGERGNRLVINLPLTSEQDNLLCLN